MAVQIGAATRRESDAVAAQKERTLWQGCKRYRELLVRGNAQSRWRSAEIGLALDQFPPPHRGAGASRLEHDGAFAAERLFIAQHAVADGDRAVHDEKHARQRCQFHRAIIGENVLAQPEHRVHRLLLERPVATVAVTCPSWKATGKSLPLKGGGLGYGRSSSPSPRLEITLSP